MNHNFGPNPIMLYKKQQFSSSMRFSGTIVVFHTTIGLNTRVYTNTSWKSCNIYV